MLHLGEINSFTGAPSREISFQFVSGFFFWFFFTVGLSLALCGDKQILLPSSSVKKEKDCH